MKLHVLPAGPIQTNAYLLTSPKSGDAVLIDAPAEVWADVAPILGEDKCRLSELWLTHGHWDHIQGAAQVVRESGAKVSGHADDRALFEHPEMMRAFADGMELEPVKVDRWVADRQVIEALGMRFEVRHTPGHCPGNVLFLLSAAQRGEEPGMAFVGDTLFRGSVGRTDFPGGDFKVLEKSIRTRIYDLPEETAIFPGHGEPTSVGMEKATNPFVKNG